MNYSNKYDAYIKYLETGQDKNYKDMLHIFFNDSPNQLCPKCNKLGIIKNIEDNKIIMKCLDKKCDWKVEIILAKYINLYSELFDKKNIKTELLYDLLITDKFNDVKKQFLSQKQDIDEIKKIFDKQKEELDRQYNKKYEILNKLLILYYKRKQVFNNISKSISSQNKNKLVEIYKNEFKSITDNRYNQLAKTLNISIDDIKNIFLWFDVSNQYIIIQQQFEDISKKIDNYKKEINYINDNMMIEIPSIIQDKKIKVGKKDIDENIDKNVDKDEYEDEDEDEDVVDEDIDKNIVDENIDKDIDEDIDEDIDKEIVGPEIKKIKIKKEYLQPIVKDKKKIKIRRQIKDDTIGKKKIKLKVTKKK